MIAQADKTTQEARPAGEDAKPRVNKRPEAQGTITWGPSVAYACGSYQPITETEFVAGHIPCAYPYWHMMLWGMPPVYRLMRNHPTIALARSTVVGPVVGSVWDLDWDDDASQAAIAWVQKYILPLRRVVMRDAIRTIDYGWQPFAIVWNIVDGKYVPAPRALLPDNTTVLEDKYGNFAGIKNGDVKFNDLESWVPALDGEAGYKYGRSRYENIRDTAWAGWLETALKAKELESKLSGIIPMVSHPPGGPVTDAGETPISFRSSAQTALNELSKGRGIAVETIGFPAEEIMEEPALAKVSLFDIKFLDAGTTAPAVLGFVSKMEYWDKLLFRGFLRSERTGMEAVSAGSRADSEQHTDTGTADSEEIDAELTWQFQSVVNTALRLNFAGQEGKVRLKAAPLLKRKLQVFRELLSRLVSIPELAISVAKACDVDAMLSQMSIPMLRKFVVEAVMEEKPKTEPENEPVNSTNGDPKPTKAEAEALADVLAIK